MLRLDTLGIRVLKTYEEVKIYTYRIVLYLLNTIKTIEFALLIRLVLKLQEWSYIPVGGSLPNTEQKNLAFGAAASMVHPATGS